MGRVANTTDIVQFYRKKKPGSGTRRANATVIDEVDGPDDSEESQDRIIRVEHLVKEFLSAQTLNVLEENGLGTAIENYVDKDDKRALADFIEDTLKEHVEVILHLRNTQLTHRRHLLKVKWTRRIWTRKSQRLKIGYLRVTQNKQRMCRR